MVGDNVLLPMTLRGRGGVREGKGPRNRFGEAHSRANICNGERTDRISSFLPSLLNCCINTKTRKSGITSELLRPAPSSRRLRGSARRAPSDFNTRQKLCPFKGPINRTDGGTDVKIEKREAPLTARKNFTLSRRGHQTLGKRAEKERKKERRCTVPARLCCNFACPSAR